MLGWELPPHNSGGLGVACYELCKSLASKGADIEFVIPYTAHHQPDFMKVTSALHITAQTFAKSFGAYQSCHYGTHDSDELHGLDMHTLIQRYEHAIDHLVEILDFDVIHAHDWLTFRAALRAKQISGKPLVLHVHSIESDRSGGNSGNQLVREIEFTSMLLADKVIAVSQHTKRAIVHEYGIPPDLIEVVHNSINFERFTEIPSDNSYRYLTAMKHQGYRVVVNVGRLTIQKGLPNLLQAAAKVVRKAPKTLFLIVGSGEQERELIELAAQLGIGRNVLFTGFQRGKGWRDAFLVGDLFVMPSISEPFGLTPLEAAGFGTPSLISKQSGVSEILQNCLKVDFWDVDEMANQIHAVVSSSALQSVLTENVINECERLSWNESADKMLDIYRQHVGVQV